jgi:transcriptional regulator with XRE-family HTH domain
MEGKELQEWRDAHDLTQTELAERLEVARNTVARWERGERTIPNFLRLALERIEEQMSLSNAILFSKATDPEGKPKKKKK